MTLPERTTVYGLAKMGWLEHVQPLFERGLVYMNTWKRFKDGEDGSVRFDRYEGVGKIIQGQSIKHVQIRAGSKVLFEHGSDFRGFQLCLPDAEQGSTNIYCMTALTRLGGFPWDRRFLRFGNWCVIIKEPREFTDRVLTALRARTREEIAPCLMEYVPKNHTGDMGPGRKFDRFAYQQEFRIVARPLVVTGGPMTVEIGSIEDIALLLPLSQIGRLQFSLGRSSTSESSTASSSFVSRSTPT